MSCFKGVISISQCTGSIPCLCPLGWHRNSPWPFPLIKSVLKWMTIWSPCKKTQGQEKAKSKGTGKLHLVQ